MFEINIRVKIDSEGEDIKNCIVENTVSMDGEVKMDVSEEFDHPIKAYTFVADYFDDMVESLMERSGIMEMLKPTIN